MRLSLLVLSGSLQVVVAKVPEASETPMTLWQEFQSKRAAGIVCSR